MNDRGRPSEIPIARIPISLPCQARVLPGTDQTDASLAERTETCSTDAWWMIGTGFLCDQHLRGALGESYDRICGDAKLNRSELLPWNKRHRYSQEPDGVVATGDNHE